MAKIETLNEDFEFGGIDSGKWTTTNSQVVAGTNLDLEITSAANNAGNYISLNSIATYTLVASSTFIQLTSVGNQSLASWEVYPIYLVADTNNKIFIRITGNQVQPMKVVANTTSTVGTAIAYNAATMKWFRIRESGGTTYWEYASDPTGTWTNPSDWSIANPITLTALTYEVLCGTWASESSTTTATFDNINVTPAQYQFSWKGFDWNKRIHAGPAINNQIWSPSNITGPDGSNYITLSLTNPSGSSPIGCEVFSVRRGFGYGTYTMVVATELDNIAQASCFGGMFTFDFTNPPAYREIDVDETRKYGQTNKQVLHSHVYDSGGSGTFITDNMDIPANVIQTHRLIWTPSAVTFDAFLGTGTGGTNYFHTVHTTNLPTPGLERVHFNTFVDVNVAGASTVPQLDVIIRDFTFTPMTRAGTSSRGINNGRTVTGSRSITNGRSNI